MLFSAPHFGSLVSILSPLPPPPHPLTFKVAPQSLYFGWRVKNGPGPIYTAESVLHASSFLELSYPPLPSVLHHRSFLILGYQKDKYNIYCVNWHLTNQTWNLKYNTF